MSSAYPVQYPNPFPTYAAPTDSMEWGELDTYAWLRECTPSAGEIRDRYDENEATPNYGRYECGVEYALYRNDQRTRSRE
jgi:hypothetical protein